MSQKFNNIYNLIMEKVNATAISAAVNICKTYSKNPLIQSLGNKFDELANEIIKISNLIENDNLSNFTYLRRSIQTKMRNKGFMQHIIKIVGNLTNIYQKDAKKLNKIINNAEFTAGNLYYYDELSRPFMTALFNHLELNKTSSTANIGRGQLILGLIIKNAYFNGTDDLTVNGKKYNVKYIYIDPTDKNSANKSALISHQDIANEDFFKLKEYMDVNPKESQKRYKKIQQNILNNINNPLIIQNEYKLEPYTQDAFTELFFPYLEKITRGVDGYILVTDNFTDNSNTFTLKYYKITTEQIRFNPYKYLYSIKYGNQRPGIYFKGDILI